MDIMVILNNYYKFYYIKFYFVLYIENDKTCEKCEKQCSKCIDQPNKCLECNDKYLLNIFL